MESSYIEQESYRKPDAIVFILQILEILNVCNFLTGTYIIEKFTRFLKYFFKLAICNFLYFMF